MYYLLKGILYPISLLPLGILYGLSNFLYFVLYTCFGYRKVVTRNNLLLSFPEKSVAEIIDIEKKFYLNLCDSIVESIKLISISKKELGKMFTTNFEILDKPFAEGRNAQSHISHLFNWEAATVHAGWFMNYQFVGIYNRISSKAFNKLMYTTRSRSGVQMIDMDDMQVAIPKVQKQPNIMWGIISDQNPSEPRRGHWHEFLHRETVFFKGAELIARRYNNVVFFGKIVKVKRGKYKIELVEAFANGGATKDGEITTAYIKYLEECIKQQPENWVWSHRRWKHVKKASN